MAEISDIDRLENFIDFMCESILEATDEEMLEEMPAPNDGIKGIMAQIEVQVNNVNGE